MIKLQIKRLKLFVQKFITSDLWTIEVSGIPNYKKWLIKGIRTVTLAFRGFKEDKVSLRASALTFYSVLSVVPIMAMAFGVAKGFGFDGKLKVLLRESLQGQEDVANFLIEFSSNMLDSVQGGWIFGIGLIFLLWSILQVLGNIESAFNSIWQVKRSRVFFRKFSDYFSIMLVAPILILLSSSIQVFIIDMVNKITNEVSFVEYLGPFLYTAVKLIPFVIIWLLFTFIYMVMPNTKVKFGSALIAGIVAGTTFQLLQWGYIHFQIGVSKYNGIYGSFAALPLFLVWLNWSWLIVLFGAEISFSAQNQHQYEYEGDIKHLSKKSLISITLVILHAIVKTFEKGDLPLTAQELSKKLKLPVRLVRSTIYNLIECNILAETPSDNDKDPAFIPMRDIHGLTIHEVINVLYNQGNDFQFMTENTDELDKIQELLNSAGNEFKRSNLNKLLHELEA